MPDEPQAIAEKYHGDAVPVIITSEAPVFAAGATSFEELDRFRVEEKRDQALSYTFDLFQSLLGNLMANDGLSANERVSGMRSLVEQLAGRIDAVAADPDIAFKAERYVSNEGAAQADGDALTVFKDASDRYRWVAVHSNRYKDREGDIFPSEAHDEYVEWANGTKQYLPLRLWHAPYDIGPGDGLDYADGFVVSTGTFYPGMEQVARNLKEMSDRGELACSHGFTYKPRDYRDGIYHHYRSFEVTVLPREAAANLLTDYGVKEALVLNPQRRAFFVKALGEEGAKTLEAQLATLGQKAQSDGVAFKELFVGVDLDAVPETKEAPVLETPSSMQPPVATPVAAPAAAAPAVETPAAATLPPVAAPAAAAATEFTPPAVAAAPVVAVVEVPVASLPTAADATTTAPLPPSLEAVAGERALTDFKSILDGALAQALMPVLGRLDALEGSKDAAIAAAIRPQVGPTGVLPASQAQINVASEAAAAAVKAASEIVGEATGPVSPHFKALAAAMGHHTTE